MPSTTHENPSPSASSIFLPLGRRVRRDSKSSLPHDLDQDALNEALDTIHNAASQSQDLTVFNEYTDPPSATSPHENKTLAGEIQGGISGLYNKIKASVGAVRDTDEHHDAAAASHPVERSVSQASSDGTSKVQSSLMPPFDAPPASDAPQLPLKLSSKAASVNKASVSSTPSLRSPTGPPQPSAHIADPTVTEVNIHATGSSATHSRTGSNYEVEFAPHERGVSAPGDGESLRRVISKTATDVGGSDRVGRLLTSPLLSATNRPNNHNLPVSHDRGLSANSISSHFSNADVPAGAPGHGSREDKSLTRVTSNRQDGVLQRHVSNPLDPLGDHQSNLGKPVVNHGKASEPALNSSGLTSIEERPKDKPQPRISQSRLPSFRPSRNASSDSIFPPTLSRTSRASQDGHVDGFHEVDIYRVGAAEPHDKLRSRLLSKEFWMRDENAKDCFLCGEPFTTFRRKHHCRTCGQIFDNKCTVLISGTQFGSGRAVRVCKPCEAIITSHDDDSSDYSIDDLTLPDSAVRPRTPEQSPPSRAQSRFEDDDASVVSQSLEQMSKTPTMSFPVRRAFEGSNRTSAVLEFDTPDRPLPRPSSSRSLRATHSIGHGHKRHHSRHQHIRSFKAYHEDRAPFQRRAMDDGIRAAKSSAFHRDSIIDPDLAQYLSDDASSEDEQSISINLQPDKLSRSGPDSDKTAIGGLLAAVRKGRSRIGDRSIAGLLNFSREGDDGSVSSSRTPDAPRGSRKRNLSVASSVHQRLTPKATRERLSVVIPGGQDDSQDGQVLSRGPVQGSRMIRSASMHGIGAPAMELNRASIQHVHKLLRQLLKDAEIQKASSWEDALIPILLKATDEVDPDVQGGDDIDIRNYVKLKKIPGGKPEDTAYISGLIFTKNVALKSMSRCISNPQILIITFALEYARHEQHFMSLDPVIRQEREYLENLVGRIASLKPDLLLAQRNISGLALELLDKAKITTIFNVRSSVLEAVSRCTQTHVVHSMDKLASQPGQLGTCDSFEVKTFVADGRKKTYIYLSGCPPQLGCTVALRGADRKTLAQIKRVTEFMIYVVYNLKLETCLMRDEWALIPSAPKEHDHEHQDGSTATNTVGKVNETSEEGPRITIDSRAETDHEQQPQSNADPDVSNADVTASEKDGHLAPAVRTDQADSVQIPDDVPVPTFYEDMVVKHQTRILSASPFVKFMQPYLLMRARELERRVAYLKRLRDQDLSAEQNMDDKGKVQKFTLIQPEMVHRPLAGASKKVREIIHAVHDAEYDGALHNYETQKKQWEAYLSGNRNLFDPYAHQNIVVLFSQVSTETSVPCSGPDLLAFSFYNEHEQEEEFEADCTLGQYVEDLCYRANDTCPSDSCEKKMYEHHRQYVHGEAQITVFLQPYPAKMRGLQDVILMWSQCKICGVETTVTPMSASTWKYSFGKYLELSFWSADLHARAGICPHDLHRDHLRYFGYKDFALRVHYDPIDLLEIIVPRLRMTWKVDNDLKFRNDVYTRLEHRITRFMVSVKLRLKSINVDALLPEHADSCRSEIERLTKRATEEHATLIKQIQERYSNSRYWEIIPLNRAIRAMQEMVAEWDTAFAEFERSFFPSENDIRRLATLQLKKIFLDRDVSVTSLTSNDEGLVTPPIEEGNDEKGANMTGTEGSPPVKRTAALSPEKTQNVLQSVLEEHSSPANAEKNATELVPSTKDDRQSLSTVSDGPCDIDEVRHLDLALPSLSPHISASNTETASQPPQVTGGTNNSHEPPSFPPSLDEKGPHVYKRPVIESGPPSQPIDLPARTPNSPRLASTSGRPLEAKPTSPNLVRTHSQPTGSVAVKRGEQEQGTTSTLSAINAINGFGSIHGKPIIVNGAASTETNVPLAEKKLTDRLGLSHLKNNKYTKGHSFIPRAIANRKESRVSSLAKHFEQLSREFERERIRERKLRAARNRQSRIYPLSASKPIVEVYRNVDEAVDERDVSDDSLFNVDGRQSVESGEASKTADGMAESGISETAENGFHVDESAADGTENEADVQESVHAPSETEDRSDEDEGTEEIQLPDSAEDLIRLTQEDIDLKELPKHERTSLMKMLTNFWAERSSSGWTPLEYPLRATEHIFADCDIIVREDEPSSIIAFALGSEDYKTMLQDIQKRPSRAVESTGINGLDPADHPQADVMHSLLRKTGIHLKYQFQEGPAKMLCKIFFAEQFDAVRKKCGVADRIVESLSRCLKWDSKGGKTKSLFLKTLDDRFVLKSLSPIETQSFLKFAPNYFQIMSEAFFHELPSVIAKMLGFYQIIVKNPVTGVEYNWFLLVMENLFYDRTPTRIFDLKGSMRNRKINATGERNEVLLDENMVEFIYESPLFTREHSKKLLRSSVHNDTLFLARQNVMDYSLMVAIDERRKELVVGIIDCIRTYTWDKKLESWIKDRGFAGGGKNRPTVTSPKEYKRRFRVAMNRYVLEAPSCWHQFKPVRVEKRMLRIEDDKDGDKGENEVPIIG